MSIYLHMSKINVKAGEIVKADQPIGQVGSTGISTGPHLHFGIYIYGTPVDPFEYWVKQAPEC
jgi:murein DD-endopeptidase MepM/ murein hydrolase activator NlpD